MSSDIVALIAHLQGGGLILMPTETVWGLAADARSPEAVGKIYALKGRPAYNPLIVHVADAAAARGIAVFDDRAEHLAAALWPGPLTLVLPMRYEAGLAALVTAGLPTVAVRVPSHSGAAALCRAAGFPLAAPSANLSGQLSPTRASDIDPVFKKEALLLDDGTPAAVGVESTIVALDGDGWRVLRVGGIPMEKLEAILGSAPKRVEEGIRAPGMMVRHYAPTTPLRLNATEALINEALLCFGQPEPNGGAVRKNLSLSGNLEEAARNLYAFLHDLDHRGYQGIAVVPIPYQGIGVAINDRLQRAATPAMMPSCVTGSLFP
ncbi:MAG: L-threonylcarbamoyladenylate synthase [Holosporales bacterium]|jgi:L-threonylcarbamoyladenylate synthase